MYILSQVYLDESLCGTIKYSPGTNPYKIQCGSHKVQEIKIVGGELDGYLTLCEVQVFSRTPAGGNSVLSARTLEEFEDLSLFNIYITYQPLFHHCSL